MLAALLVVERFPRGVAVLAGLLVALAAGWTALRSEGARRVVAACLTAAGLVAAVLALVLLGSFLVDLVVVALAVAALLCARAAFRMRVELPAAPIELGPGDDLRELIEKAVAAGDGGRAGPPGDRVDLRRLVA